MEVGEETQEEESGLMTIHNVTRAHAGLYQCIVNNGIAPPASADVQLVVQCESISFIEYVRTEHTWRVICRKIQMFLYLLCVWFLHE